MTDYYTLYFDGACGPKNPGGTAAYGFVLHHGAEVVERGHGVVGSGPGMTNNVAEYMGLYHGLVAFSFAKWTDPTTITVQVYGDSLLVINQMSKRWKVRAGLYTPYAWQAAAMAHDLRKIGVKLVFEWVPREQNTECDALSKRYVSLT